MKRELPLRRLALLVAASLVPATAHARCGADPKCIPPLRFLHEDGVLVPFSDGSTAGGAPDQPLAADDAAERIVSHAVVAPYAARAAISLRSCAGAAERASASASGDVTVSWRIIDGVARSPTVVADTTGLPDVAACVAERVGGVRMPRGSNGFVLGYVWRLAREAN
jgi:hypothetical protein